MAAAGVDWSYISAERKKEARIYTAFEMNCLHVIALLRGR